MTTTITLDAIAPTTNAPTFIYRGFAYQPAKHAQRRTPKPMIYRGIAHDGMAIVDSAPTGPRAMVYRGMRYTR